jgi:hypothetical protein
MRLRELVTVVRSKNAGPFMITLDVFFPDVDSYELVRRAGVLEPESVAHAYQLEPGQVLGPFWDVRALGAKVTIPKQRWSAVDCTDLLGSHHHGPLAEMEVGNADRDPRRLQ